MEEDVMRAWARGTAWACAAALLAGSALTLLTAATPAGAAPGAATAAGAAPVWTIQKSPNLVVPSGQIYATSCSSARACVGVGTSVSRTGVSVTLAERWNGAAWKRPHTPNPAGGHLPVLTGVSCPVAGFCAAVGSYEPNAAVGGSPLAEMWNGRSWAIAPVPLPPGATSGALGSVSCPSASFCEAVGSDVNSSGTEVALAESWNGTTWSPQSVPSPSGSLSAFLTGVSCVSATFCAAVGAAPAFSVPSFSVLWNGTVWQMQAMPSGAGVSSVSCTGASSCEAAGGDSAAAWNGSSWALQSVPLPAGANSVTLRGVSCATASSCETVGSADDGSGTSVTLGEGWNGTSWSAQSTPSPAGAPFAELRGVSCTASGTCEAGGDVLLSQQGQAHEALAAVWAGGAWQAQSAAQPRGAAANSLNAVSCVSVTFCEAVGSHANAVGDTVGLAEARRESAWSVQPTPDPARSASGVRLILYGVSCASTRFCAAVGYSAGGPGAGTEIWNGSAWKLRAAPGTAYLASVSCPSAEFCEAVGGNAETDTWNGASWSAQAPAAGFTSLTSVSCTSPTFCEATGFGPAGENAETWNGSTWTAQATPTPSGGNSSGLEAVSCTTPASCEAVGGYNLQSTGQGVTLAEGWNGSAWTVQPTPNPQASLGSGLGAVACTSARSCAAVGAFGRSAPSLALAEVWNGAIWSLRSAQDRPGAGQNVLNGVSCGAPGACTAAGVTADRGQVAATLVEIGG
jgi:hypothetical protein